LEVRRVDKYRKQGFPSLTVRRILTKAGAKRVSKEGVEEMIRTLNEAAIKVAKESILIAQSSPHSLSYKKMETITAEDVAIATKRILSNQDLQ